MDKQIQAAIKLLNENNYIVIPVNKAQMALCKTCTAEAKWCQYNSIGYACSSLVCMNKYIEEQLDYESKIASVMGEE